MAAEIHDLFEQAFVPMVHRPCLQPVEDVNQRVSRLAACELGRIEQLRAEFAGLHGGNAVRFGLRALDLAAWQQQQQHAPPRRR